MLAGRVRKPEESLVISEVIQKHFKRSVDPDKLFTLTQKTSCTTVDLLKSVITESPKDFSHVVWTYNMRRLAVLIGQAILFKEPILLVGETGYVVIVSNCFTIYRSSEIVFLHVLRFIFVNGAGKTSCYAVFNNYI